jgi:hypothetical protein
VQARLAATITVDGADLPPALMATLKHAATMPNPIFYERQRRRASTWDTPRFIQSFDQTIAGDLVLPRGLGDRLDHLIGQAGSRLEVTDDRSTGQPHQFVLRTALDPETPTLPDAAGATPP